METTLDDSDATTGSYVRLETVGRRTGKPHQVILRFVTYDGRIMVFTQKGFRPDWLRNIASNPSVRVYGEGRIIDGHASLKEVSDTKDPLLGVFTRKYGKKVVLNDYWGQRGYVEIEPVNSKQADDYRELVYGDLEAAFDGVAQDYDRHIFGNLINVWLRNRSVGLMSTLFRKGDTVLEVGCGTGTETISIAKMGVRVIAADISSRMLDELRRHAKDSCVSDLIVPVHCRPYQLRQRLADLGYGWVDGAYSTYGAINTEPRLPEFFATLHDLVKPGGRLVLGVWNKYCMYELLGYVLKGNPSMSVARLRNPVPVGKSRFCVATNAYSVGEVTSMLEGLFRLERIYGVGIFLPPSNLTKYLPPRLLLPLVKELDSTLESRYPWNRLGDHFLSVHNRV